MFDRTSYGYIKAYGQIMERGEQDAVHGVVEGIVVRAVSSTGCEEINAERTDAVPSQGYHNSPTT